MSNHLEHSVQNANVVALVLVPSSLVCVPVRYEMSRRCDRSSASCPGCSATLAGMTPPRSLHLPTRAVLMMERARLIACSAPRSAGSGVKATRLVAT